MPRCCRTRLITISFPSKAKIFKSSQGLCRSSKAVPVDNTRKCCTTRYKDGQVSINPYHFSHLVNLVTSFARSSQPTHHLTTHQLPHSYGLPNGPAFRISSSTLFSLEVPAEVRARKYLRNPTRIQGAESAVWFRWKLGRLETK